MENDDKKLLSHLTEEVVAGVKGIKLESYLVALEGWRRGLTLKWHRGERYFSLISDDKSHDFCLSRGDLVTEDAVIICNKKDETKNLLKK
ncbi:hypothetical protein ACS127_08420 [Amphibacillus sp. Q70]|uniref:hypothetical protein n=1 Tax=Amphibacillus sp. Q70 TaxID=3453416 RepID=UPI003F84EB56